MTPPADTSQVSVRCTLCGIDDATVVFPAGTAQINRVVTCNRCGLMYANPRVRVDADAMRNWVDDATFDYAVRNPQRFEKEFLQVRDYDATRAALGVLYPKRGKVLEIGSSLGLNLREFQKLGWDVLGVEPDKHAARYAVTELGIPTLNAILEDAALPSASVDVVVMLHVIEHVADPMRTLREIFRVLKPGGHLVLETPRYDTLMFKVLGRRERSLSCDGHIYFFTQSSLNKCTESAGFKTVDFQSVGRSLTFTRLVYNVGVMTRSAPLKSTFDTWARRLGLQKLHFTINVGDMQRVLLQRPTLG
jgi:SAM-dependent methyltransferase